jgi:hypothetical protein
LRWRRERLQVGRQQRAQVQVVELLPCRGSGACIIVTISPPELRSGHYDIEDKQQGTCACRQAAGRSTLVLSLRMMKKYFDPSRRTFAELPRVRESRPFRARMEFGEAATFQPIGLIEERLHGSY